MTLVEWAKKNGVSYKSARASFHNGRLPGAYQLPNRTIVVPEDTTVGPRRKTTGRITGYRIEYDQKAYEFCAEYGLTNDGLAKLFEVTLACLNLWKVKHVSFMDAIKKGKDDWDTVGIEKSLRRRARGYSYTETTKEPEDGEMVVTKEVIKHMAPETGAMCFWLKNRQPGRWRDKQNIEVTGNLTRLAPEKIEKE